ncbi:hypothetical protein DEU56DRAFT_918751 [Suillus clintonianus]|uniref:uncharacterized protein n=1 Tax=Suillus clintonianus TaxID=1904413 RepID=UPI001B8775A9|nr:uncharacterized protein DEU56DRAFT_918751 [Suillus clintonianus]KAG2118591.1 hypothetical protein DEU56DRAFT_918751 [Suillus clintonianus]
MLSDVLDNDLIWSSSMLHVSDLYTRTLYLDALVAADAVFMISTDLWVLQDWDGDEEVLQLGSYFHVVYLPRSDDEYGVACMCPLWKAAHACIHQDTLCSFIDTLRCLPLIAPFPAPPAVLLQSTPFNNKYIFSCASAVGRYESGKHVVITLQQDGRWHCHLCCYSDACKHKPHAKAFALAAGLMTNTQDGHQMGAVDYVVGDEESAILVHAAQYGVNMANHRAISYLPIPPL